MRSEVRTSMSSSTRSTSGRSVGSGEPGTPTAVCRHGRRQVHREGGTLPHVARDPDAPLHQARVGLADEQAEAQAGGLPPRRLVAVEADETLEEAALLFAAEPRPFVTDLQAHAG